MQYPKILLATPTSDYKEYCRKDWCAYLKTLTYPNLDILIVDNSSDPEYHKVFEKDGFKVLHLVPKKNEDIKYLIARSQEVLRNYCILGGYDFLFSLESDIFSAPNIIEHLLSFRKSVVGLSYFIGSGCFSEQVMFETETFGYSSLSRTADPERAFLLFDGQLKNHYQIGLGCILIATWVLELIKFRADNIWYSDVLLHQDLKTLGIPTYLDTSNLANHRNGSWEKVLASINQKRKL
jgi:hypothetical protein